MSTFASSCLFGADVLYRTCSVMDVPLLHMSAYGFQINMILLKYIIMLLTSIEHVLSYGSSVMELLIFCYIAT